MSAKFSLDKPGSFPSQLRADRLAEVSALSRRWVSGAVLSRCRYDHDLLGDGSPARLLVLDLYGSMANCLRLKSVRCRVAWWGLGM
jgi:hypothetical protein